MVVRWVCVSVSVMSLRLYKCSRWLPLSVTVVLLPVCASTTNVAVYKLKESGSLNKAEPGSLSADVFVIVFITEAQFGSKIGTQLVRRFVIRQKTPNNYFALVYHLSAREHDLNSSVYQLYWGGDTFYQGVKLLVG